jgi:hypothetical protein
MSLIDFSEHSRNEHEWRDCVTGFDQRYELESAYQKGIEYFE